jgi:phosphatidylglycerol:prolipoprotein diacylglycerol transferase
MVNYIIWNGSPALFSIGSFVLRWYGALFILGFLLCRRILLHIYKKEDRPLKEVDTLALYIIISSVLGARLGHVIFFQPDLISSKPLEIFLPFEFQPVFHFTGLRGLSSHGAAFGILLALLLYSRRNKSGHGYLKLLDRFVIVVALAGAFILASNFFNSEPIGRPTDSLLGTVLIRPITDGLLKVPCCIMRNPGGKNPLDFVSVKKDEEREVDRISHSPIILYLFFNPGVTEQIVKEFLLGDVKTYLFDRSEFVYEPGTEPLHYTIFVEKDVYTARVRTIGIARHPVQLYECVSCLLLFAFLFRYWKKHKVSTPPGRIFGIFFITFWGLHFIYDYLKIEQAPIADRIALSIGQVLSVSFFLAGVVVLANSYRNLRLRGDY